MNSIPKGAVLRRALGFILVAFIAAIMAADVVGSAHPNGVPLRLLWKAGGHSREINAVTFSPDGRTLASASDDGSIKLWRMSNGALLRTFIGHDRDVHSIAFTPDGRRLVSGGDDATVRVWRVADGALLLTIVEGDPYDSDYRTNLRAISLSRDGSLVVSGLLLTRKNESDHGDSTTAYFSILRVRRMDGTLVQTFESRTTAEGIRSLALSPDATMLASGGPEGVTLWSQVAGGVIQTLTNHTGAVRFLSFSPSGDLLAACDMSSDIKLWTVLNGQPAGILAGHNQRVRTVEFSGDGGLLASASFDKTIKLWRTFDRTEVFSIRDTDEARTVTFSPDGGLLASGNKLDEVKVWDANNASLLRSFTRQRGRISQVAFSPDQRRLASIVNGQDDLSAKVWRAADGKLLSCVTNESEVMAAAFSPDGRRLILGTREDIQVVNPSSGARLVRPIGGLSDSVFGGALSPDLTLYATWGSHYDPSNFTQTGILRLWRVTDGVLLRSFSTEKFSFGPATFTPDSKAIAIADGEVVWLRRISDRRLLLHLQTDHSIIQALAISNDGQTLASGGSYLDGTVQLWRLHNGSRIHTLPGHSNGVARITFAPNDVFIASAGSFDNTLKLWRPKNGQLLKSYNNETLDIHSLAFSSKQRLLAWGRRDATLVVATTPLSLPR